MAERRGTIFLLLGMLAWVAAAIVATLVAWGIVSVSWSVLHRFQIDAVPEPGPLVKTFLGACGFHGTLLFGALLQGKRLVGGGWFSGIGIHRIGRAPLIALLCFTMICWLVLIFALAAAFPALRELMQSMTPEFLLTELESASPAAIASLVVLVMVVAPVAEEFFFRGWLWEASRRRGHSVVVTATLTAIPWLLLHGVEAPGRILFILPAAVIFSTARHLGGGVLASLTVHLTNNLGVLLVQAVPRLLGPG